MWNELRSLSSGQSPLALASPSPLKCVEKRTHSGVPTCRYKEKKDTNQRQKRIPMTLDYSNQDFPPITQKKSKTTSETSTMTNTTQNNEIEQKIAAFEQKIQQLTKQVETVTNKVSNHVKEVENKKYIPLLKDLFQSMHSTVSQ